MINNLLEHISYAKKEALRKGIAANTIVIDSYVAYLNGFPTMLPNSIMGLEIRYADDLSQMGYNFMIYDDKSNPLSKYSNEELIQELKRRLEEVSSDD